MGQAARATPPIGFGCGVRFVGMLEQGINTHLLFQPGNDDTHRHPPRSWKRIILDGAAVLFPQHRGAIHDRFRTGHNKLLTARRRRPEHALNQSRGMDQRTIAVILDEAAIDRLEVTITPIYCPDEGVV